MKAVVYTATGPSSVLTLTDRPMTEPGEGEVRVRIVRSGVNPTDWKARKGASPGVAMPAPQVPNQDGSGVVDAVGPGVTDVEIGRRVWVWDAAWQRSDGTAQELVVLPVGQVVALPDDESYETGASLGIPALTAHRALTANENWPARLSPGSLEGAVVLVAGGAGAVSHAAIQLAAWAGATVVTTVSTDEKAELARAAGAHHVVNYRTEDVAARVGEIAPDGVDTVVEVNLAANLGLDIDVSATNGTIAVYTSEPPDPLPVPVRQSMTKNLRYQFVLTYTTSPQQKQHAVADVSAALSAGALRVGVEHGLPVTTFALADTAAAHDAVEQATVGKVLVDVSQR